MLLFCDTSSLLKLFIEEAGSASPPFSPISLRNAAVLVYRACRCKESVDSGTQPY